MEKGEGLMEVLETPVYIAFPKIENNDVAPTEWSDTYVGRDDTECAWENSS